MRSRITLGSNKLLLIKVIMRKPNKKKIKTEKPLVSVIIPVFNGAQYLTETIASVQESTYKNIEIILIDDGSKDESKSLCRTFTRKYSNIHFYSFKRNNGLGRVLNYALKKSHGDYICRINQDDRMRPQRISVQIHYLLAHPDVVALGTNIQLFNNQGETQIIQFAQTDEEIKRIWHIVSPFSDPSVMYKKAVALKVGGYRQEFWPADDTHLWIRMGKAGKLANLPRALVDVRYHDQAASIKHFRKLALVTYTMHRWMHEYIEAASLPVQCFWLGELAAGYMLSPHANWRVYRGIKKVFYWHHKFTLFLRNLKHRAITVHKEIIQPALLNRSGQ